MQDWPLTQVLHGCTAVGLHFPFQDTSEPLCLNGTGLTHRRRDSLQMACTESRLLICFVCVCSKWHTSQPCYVATWLLCWLRGEGPSRYSEPTSNLQGFSASHQIRLCQKPVLNCSAVLQGWRLPHQQSLRMVRPNGLAFQHHDVA